MRRAAITTSSDRVEGVAAVFAATGLTPVALPCVRIEPASAETLQRARAALVEDTVLLRENGAEILCSLDRGFQIVEA